MNKIEQTMHVIREQISSKQLLEGSRLVSVRRMASQLNHSVSTVVEAYARLVGEGLIESRAGAGFYVCGRHVRLPIASNMQPYHREIDPLWISRQSLDAPTDMLKPGCGWLPESWMPEQSIRKALKVVSRLGADVLTNYSSPQGHLGLRQWIARKKQFNDQYIHESQIILTDSATQSIDLVFQLLLQPGDVILIDDPCYFNFHVLAKKHHLHSIAIPMLKDGPDIKSFTEALAFKPKLYLTNSGIHNPTGAVLTTQVAYQIAKLAESANVTIVEDDIFADFEILPAPKYAALAGLNQVVQLGSFSKTLSAAVRCGYIIANPNRVDALIDLKIATQFSNAQLNAEIVYQALTDSAYRKHVEWIKNHAVAAMNQTIQRLAALNIKPWIIPKGGIFLWCELPLQLDAAAISKICLQHGVLLAPGSSFSQSQQARHFLRFNVAQCNDKKIYDVLALAIQRCTSTDSMLME
ncbi:DNA-binding transcriptional MocR family regulator [Acinetobacter calcoaceticus]|uniref:DNA-binding transcriptional MocR family regulator n=1 Tax=Acinetobacter calcoaceticus TaxID=471 RepID=A0A4R1XRF9_ACICA|nr:DNA-binding transcriptional MocR family regulator [Acinetobacter calcoaceticus]